MTLDAGVESKERQKRARVTAPGAAAAAEAAMQSRRATVIACAVVPLSRVVDSGFVIAVNNCDFFRRVSVINRERKTEMLNCVNWVEVSVANVPLGLDDEIDVSGARGSVLDFAINLRYDNATENTVCTALFLEALHVWTAMWERRRFRNRPATGCTCCRSSSRATR